MTYRRQEHVPESRKAPRRKMNYPAHIEIFDAAPMQHCVIVDISKTGAKLGTTTAMDLPDSFTLVLGGPAAARRPCKVIWRQQKYVGVHFLPPPQTSRFR
jgi:hypothetical protein